MEKTVAELFAGVGGFRVGLNEVTLDSDGNTIEKDNFKFVYANQWEPSTKAQHAFDCYVKRFGESKYHTNIDICEVDKKTIPDHNLLVGGFPCQDYSVARSLSNEKGIEGKKGVLWWQINEVLEVKKPPFVLLENVDRLIKSPSSQRGRDFGIMLRCFNDLGYTVEWRVINAGEYGFPQRRRRIFIFAYLETTNYFRRMREQTPYEIISTTGLFACTFPAKIEETEIKSTSINKVDYPEIFDVSENFKFKFQNTGLARNHNVFTAPFTNEIDFSFTLEKIILKDNVPDVCFLTPSQLSKFKYLKGKKKVERKKNGITYYYSEGKITYPDRLDLPGRTMLTSEGTVNRSTHVIKDIKSQKYRILTPIEAERLNQFPDDWTNTGMPFKRRYFMMGNALVCGVIKRIGHHLLQVFNDEI